MVVSVTQCKKKNYLRKGNCPGLIYTVDGMQSSKQPKLMMVELQRKDNSELGNIIFKKALTTWMYTVSSFTSKT